MRRVSTAAALLFALLSSSAASAQPSALRWSAPPECPREAAVRAEVARLLGGDWPDSPTVAEAETTRTEMGFRLVLTTETDGVPGERTIEGERCEELAAATALILALMIDPVAVTRVEPEPSPLTRPPSPAPPPRLAAALSVPVRPRLATQVGSPDRSFEPERVVEIRIPEPAPSGPPARVEDATLGGFVGAVGLLDVGTLPGPAPGVALEAGFGVPLIDGRLRATFLGPSAGLSAENPGVGVELMALTLEARGCVRPIAEARWIGACAGASGGALFGRGFGVSDPTFGAGAWLGGSLGLAVAWAPVRWFDLGLEADLVVPLNPLTFFVIRDALPLDVFTQPAAAGRFGLSAHVRF